MSLPPPEQLEALGYRRLPPPRDCRAPDERSLPEVQMALRLRIAEGKLAALRAVLLEGGQDAAAVRRRAIVIIGSGEDGS